LRIAELKIKGFIPQSALALLCLLIHANAKELLSMYLYRPYPRDIGSCHSSSRTDGSNRSSTDRFVRSNDGYTEIPGDPSEFGSCQIQDGRGEFEPPDYLKGDLARVWLYMSLRHGVTIIPDERDRFEQWSADDPVSRWESQREKRIFDYTFIQNPFVHGVTPDSAGACPWE